MISTFTLAMEEPLDDPDSLSRQLLAIIDKTMTVIFLIEATLKIITVGFLFNGKQSYLREASNILDFMIVVSALISWTTDADIAVMKVLRTVRVLRPFRIFSRLKILEIVMQSLYHALPKVINLQLVVLFFMYIFAIMLTTIFSGTSMSCNLEQVQLSSLQKEKLIKTKWDCLNYGGEWLNDYVHFDNLLQSLVLIFIMQSG